ncbi:glycoside hydrolase family 30 beta sandwich domain-containing protein [Spirosoma luteolum]
MPKNQNLMISHLKPTVYACTLSLLLTGCQRAAEPVAVTPKPAATVIAINPQTTYQTIAGFGGANRMWGTQSLLPADAQKAFGTGDNELGLSIFRVRLSSNKSDWPIIVEAVKEANKRGVKVLASPWSPPPALKSNNSEVRGYLLPDNYKPFKDYINEYVTYMAQRGATIDVVSIQNEPDWKPTYESCDYTADDFISFLRAPGTIAGVKLAAPESLNFNQGLTNAILNDAEASKKIDIVAGHIYGGGLARLPLAEQQQKEIWMTEYLLNLDTGNAGAPKWSTYSETAKWDESLKMLTSVHDAMSNNWNAYIWWYLQRYYSFIGDGEEGTATGAILKRGYAFSHYARFVRPGFVRISVDNTSAPQLRITAYKKGSQTVVVLINPGTSAVSNLQLNGLTPASASAYTTTLTASMAPKNLTVADRATSLDIPPASVTTVIINQ